jgi:hypothetical protein
MTISDAIMILAVLAGPVIAVQLTRYLDNKKEIRERKLQVFKTLMATRVYNASWDHVMALNRIDLEFDAKNIKRKGGNRVLEGIPRSSWRQIVSRSMGRQEN